jgi:hypothetical protein
MRYIASELRRRKGRTFLTALGLGVGVGLVVAVSALSNGLDDAQDKVLRPLTGVGTDMSVSRPLKISRGSDQSGGGRRCACRSASKNSSGRRTAASASGSGPRKPGRAFLGRPLYEHVAAELQR